MYIPALQIDSSVVFFYIPYTCINIWCICFSLSVLLHSVWEALVSSISQLIFPWQGFSAERLLYSTQSLFLAGPEYESLPCQLLKLCSDSQRLLTPCGLPSSTAPKLCRSPEWGAGQLLEAFGSLPKDATLLRCKPEILQLQLEARNVNCSQVNSDAKVSSLLWSHLSLESYRPCASSALYAFISPRRSWLKCRFSGHAPKNSLNVRLVGKVNKSARWFDTARLEVIC